MKPGFNDLSSPTAVQAALNEFVSLGRKAFLARYGFGSARAYVVRDPITGIEADSKAVVGAAIGFQFPEHGPLSPRDFSGGDATVAPLLQGLGFSVRHLASEQSGEDWSAPEVELIVADYLAMLTLELTGQRYNKSAHRQALLQRLPNRSSGSIEFKHANISALMLELGFPYLRGYKPRVNFQRRLMIQVVTKQVMSHRVLDDAAMAASERPAEPLRTVDFARIRTEAPRRDAVARETNPAYENRAVKRDYLEREARNRSLGRAGECFALEFERWRLVQLGLGQLAERVEHVAETQGDGLGFDIQSFEADGRDRFIEVKTTAFGERTPFFVSANEVRFARSQTQRFHLYRLFDFRASPRMFDLVGPIEQSCALDPTTFRASFG